MTAMELNILDGIQALRTPVGDAIMCFFTKLGNGGALWSALAVVLLAIPKTRKSGMIIAVSLCIEVALCNIILKNAVGRIRPCEMNTSVQLLIARPQDYSFPSGHTASSFAAAAALFFSGMTKLWKPALALAAIIAFSRMYLYVHYPTDILGGIVIGVLSAYIAKCILNYRRKQL